MVSLKELEVFKPEQRLGPKLQELIRIELEKFDGLIVVLTWGIFSSPRNI